MPVIESGGFRWHVEGNEDHGDRLGPFHEETVNRAVLSRLPLGGVFLDVGAHVGHYSVRAAVLASKVIAVEPNPATAARLRDNLALNNLSNVTVHQVAAWDSRAALRLECPGGFERDGGTKVTADDSGTVEGVPLDEILDAEPRIDLVKLDVEGADLRALKGMRKTLGRLAPAVVIEDHSVYGCYKRSDLEDLMAGMDYRVRDLAMYGCAPYLLAEPAS